MSFSILVAAAENQVIGRDGDLPWHLSADLQRFKRLTMGHPIVMGRKTYESIGRPLPGRTSIVITRQTNYQAVEGVVVVNCLEEAIRFAESLQGPDDEVFVIGGAEIYRTALPLAKRVYLTRVHAQVDGDVTFPVLEDHVWQLVEEQQHPADEKNSLDYSFQLFERVAKILQ